MRLASLHTDKGILASEGMLDNLGKGARAKLQSIMQQHVSHPDLRALVASAKTIEGSLLDVESDSAQQWWAKLLDHYSIPDANRKDCVREVASKIQEKVEDFLSDQPEQYIRGLTGSRMQRRRAMANMLSTLSKDRQRLREAHDVDAWSNSVRGRYVNELSAILALKYVEEYAKQVGQDPQQQKGPRPSKEAMAKAERVAIALWRQSNLLAAGKGSLTKEQATNYINMLKQLGVRVRWQGQKSDRFPNGHLKPVVVPE